MTANQPASFATNWHVIYTMPMDDGVVEKPCRISYAPLGWAVAGSSGWAVIVLMIGSGGLFPRVDQRGVGSSMDDSMAQASDALIAAMKNRHEAIIDWENDLEIRPTSSGDEVIFCSPVAMATVSKQHAWSTRSIHARRDTETSHWWVPDANGNGLTGERAERLARDSLAEVTAYRADLLREWLDEHKPPAPITTYIDVLREALKLPAVRERVDGGLRDEHKVDVRLEDGALHIVIRASFNLDLDRFSVENKRVFSGPLFCHTCGLPAVPFGGEDICLDPEHDHDDHDERESDRDEDHDDDEDEP